MNQVDLLIAHAVKEATDHVRDLAYRKHINASTPERRIDLFLTSLRRHLQTVPDGKHVAKRLCRRVLWADVGVLDLSGGPFSYAYLQHLQEGSNSAMSALKSSCEFAGTLGNDVDEGLEANRRLLVELKSDVGILDLHIKNVESIATKSDGVVERLINILENS